MKCPNCNAVLDEDTVFCGNCGTQIAPLYAQGATVSEAETALVRPKDGRNPVVPNYSPASPTFQTSQPAPQSYMPNPLQQFAPPSPPPVPPVSTPSPQPKRGGGGRRGIFLVSILVVLLIAVGGGLFVYLGRGKSGVATGGGGVTKTTGGGGAAVTPNGTVSFRDGSNGLSNSLTINITNLSAPPAGSQYNAWLLDTQNESNVLSLGTLTAQGQTFTLTATKNTNLLGAGNRILITQDQGPATLPTGKQVLSGTFPSGAFIHIRHLLFHFNTTPGGVGLLVGLRDQTQQLAAQALILSNAVANGNNVAIRCAAQSMINIIQGTHGAHYQPLSAQCAIVNVVDRSDGYGLLGSSGYIANAKAHAGFAAASADATDNIKLHAGHVGIIMDNINGWVTKIDQDVDGILAHPANTGNVQEIVTLSDDAFHGVVSDSTAPTAGQAGATQGYLHGQLMATLPLNPA